MHFDALLHQTAEVGILLQHLHHLRRVTLHGSHLIIFHIFKRRFCIPDQVAETRSGIDTTAQATPVVVVPIIVANVPIDEHIIAVVGEIEQTSVSQLLIITILLFRPHLHHNLVHLLVGLTISIDHVADINDIIILVDATQIVASKIIVDLFTKFIEAPIQSIYIKVCKSTMSDQVTHSMMRLLGPGVEDILRLGTLDDILRVHARAAVFQPGVVVAGTQY